MAMFDETTAQHDMKTIKQHIGTLLLLAIAVVVLSSCGDEALADRVAGSYNCVSNAALTLYGHDTVIAARDEAVTISRVDDQTVKVVVSAKEWGTGTFENVHLGDFGYMVNLSGDGQFQINGSGAANPATLAGTYAFDRDALAVTVNVKDYSSKLSIAFTNK